MHKTTPTRHTSDPDFIEKLGQPTYTARFAYNFAPKKWGWATANVYPGKLVAYDPVTAQKLADIPLVQGTRLRKGFTVVTVTYANGTVYKLWFGKNVGTSGSAADSTDIAGALFASFEIFSARRKMKQFARACKSAFAN